MDDLPLSAELRDYESRRCHICGTRFPPFGFGPPLTRPGQSLWACGRHRGEVEQIARGPVASRQDSEPRLL